MLVRGDIIDYSFASLPDGTLRNRLERVAERVKFPLHKVFIYHGDYMYSENAHGHFWPHQRVYGRVITAGWAGGWGGQKETAMSEPTYPLARITKFGRYMPIHSSLFVPNFMTKFGSEDLQSQGRMRPPPSETAFSRWCGHPQLLLGFLLHLVLFIRLLLHSNRYKIY